MSFTVRKPGYKGNRATQPRKSLLRHVLTPSAFHPSHPSASSVKGWISRDIPHPETSNKRQREMGLSAESTWSRGYRYCPKGQDWKFRHPLLMCTLGTGCSSGWVLWMKRAVCACLGRTMLQVCKQLPTCVQSAHHKNDHWVQTQLEKRFRFFSDDSFNWLVTLGHVSPSPPLHTEDLKPSRANSWPLKGPGKHDPFIK